MRALHLVKTARGATWALRQVAALRQLGVEVIVALPSAEAGLASSYAASGAQVIAADLDFTPAAPWQLLGAVGRARALIERTRPDVIHSHFVSTTVAVRLALGRAHPVPRLFQVPGPLHLEHALSRRLDLATAGPADHWIASCRWTASEYLARGVPRARVFLSYYGIEPERWRAAARGQGRLRREHGIPPDAPLAGMVAWVYRPRWLLGQRRGIKGHEDFIDAVARITHTRAETRALVVGAPWVGAARYERRLQARARRACGAALAFTGARTDVPAVYADLDVAVHPSLSENCGGAVESLAAACPTVATAVGGLPDVVVDGETGWLVPPRDPERLAAAVLEALGDPAEAARRARAGQALVGRLFDIRRTAAEVAAIYETVLGGAHRRAA